MFLSRVSPPYLPNYLSVVFKKDLKGFRDEMVINKQNYYIPVTMDELMARFVTNMERAESKKLFREQRKALFDSDFTKTDEETIKSRLTKSFKALE